MEQINNSHKIKVKKQEEGTYRRQLDLFESYQRETGYKDTNLEELLKFVANVMENNKFTFRESFEDHNTREKSLGRFYNQNSTFLLPVYNDKIATRYLGVFDDEYHHLKPLFEDIASKKEYNQVWISPSGTGKTHSLLQVGNRHYCLYFIGTGLAPSSDGTMNFSTIATQEGFSDESMKVLLRHVVNNASIHFPYVQNFQLEYAMQVLILTKLLLLVYMRFTKTDFTPKDFLLLQLNGNTGLIGSLFAGILRMKFLRSSVIMICEGIINRLNQLNSLQVVAAVDEAYILSESNYGRSFNDPTITGSYLGPIARALNEHIMIKLFAGTKVSTNTVIILESAILKEVKQPQSFIPKVLRDADDYIAHLTKHIVLTDKCREVVRNRDEKLKSIRIRAIYHMLDSLICLENKYKESTSQELLLAWAIDGTYDVLVDQISATLTRNYQLHKNDPIWIKGLLDHLKLFVQQFIIQGFYSEIIEKEDTIDLVNLTICKVKGNHYVADERASFDGVINFLKQNALWDVYYELFEGAAGWMNKASRGFLMETIFLVTLFLLQKQKVKLISILSQEEQQKLSRNAFDWLSKAEFCTGPLYEMKKMKNKNIKNLLEFLRKDTITRIFQFANVAGPEQLIPGLDFWLSVAIKLSGDKISDMELNKNLKVVQLENLFITGKELEKYEKVKQTEQTQHFLKKLVVLEQELQNLSAKKHNTQKECEKMVKIMTKIKLYKEMEMLLQKKQYQLRIRIEIDSVLNRDVITVEEKENGNIVDIKLGPTGFVYMLNGNVKAQDMLQRCVSIIRS